jgi:secreted PhoX family phosphatase
MTPAQPLTRRRLLQRTVGLPLFPLMPSWVSAATSATQAQGYRFVGMAAPGLDKPQEMATSHVASRLEVQMSDGSRRSHKLAYQTFFMTGEQVPDGKGAQVVAGGYWDINGQPIMDKSVPGKERQFFSDCPDGMSLLKIQGAKVPGVKGNAVFAVVQFEYTSRNHAGQSAYGLLPSPIAVLTLDQHPKTGQLKLVKYHNVNTAPVHGLWVTCGASLSPWNTHLSSEEYEPDATQPQSKSLTQFAHHLYGDTTRRANPYHYGHLPEVTVQPDGTGRIVKHYCLGRISHELVQVMPDERTVIMGDDWTNGGAFMFIADKKRDLSVGTLYVAKWNQTSGIGPGSATLSWIKLGHASSAEIRAMVDKGITAADIMDVRSTDPQDASFTRIPYAGKTNWVRLKPGMEKAAAFLETHRYAALAGGSMGFTKWEGTTLNAKDKKAYIAMSRIEAAMTNGSGDVKVQGPYSGAVYEQNLRGGQRDSTGQAIASDWVPVDMAAVPELISEDFGGGKLKQQDALGNFANPNKVSCPDNLKFSEKLRTLFIGEDSNTHVNNFLWAYNVDTKELTRILSTPAGAESTGLHAVDELNGFTYIMSNFQHPGDWDKRLHNKVRAAVEPFVEKLYAQRFGAGVGYLSLEMTKS